MLPAMRGIACRMWMPMNRPMTGMMSARVDAITYVRNSASPNRRNTTVLRGNSPKPRKTMSPQCSADGKGIVTSRPSSLDRAL